MNGLRNFLMLLVLFATVFMVFGNKPAFAKFATGRECVDQTPNCKRCKIDPVDGEWICISFKQGFDTQDLGKLRGIGPLGFEIGDPSQAPALFANTLSKIVGVLTVAAILWFVLQIILASYGWMSAGGDAKAIENARSKLTNAIVGLIVVFFALVLASVIGFLLGIPNILDVGKFIGDLTPK